MDNVLIQWHKAFPDAIEYSIIEAKDYVSRETEYHLVKGVMRIDLILKFDDVRKISQIKNDIAHIFKKINVFEYKSPKDSLNINDLYDSLSKCYRYCSDEYIEHEDMSLTLISKRRPNKLFELLTEKYHYNIETKYDGIYYISGKEGTSLFQVPIQFLITQELDEKQNLLLKYLDTGISQETMQKILSECTNQREKIQLNQYLDIISSANPEIFMEVITMGNLSSETKEMVKETNILAQWRAEAKAEGIILVAQNLKEQGFDISVISTVTGLSVDELKKYLKS